MARKRRQSASTKPVSSHKSKVWLAAGLAVVGVAVAIALAWPTIGNAPSDRGPNMIEPASAFEGANEQSLVSYLQLPAVPAENADAEYDLEHWTKVVDAALVSLRRELPDQPETEHLWGVTQMRLKRTQLAEPALRRAIELAPGNWQMRIDLADLFMQLGRNSEALKLLDLPESSSSQAPAQWLLLLAECQSREGQLEEARTSLSKLVQSDGNNPDAWLKLGEVQLQTQQAEEAERSARKVTQLQPGLAQAWQLLGRALALQKKTDQSKQALLKWQELTSAAPSSEPGEEFDVRHAREMRKVHSSIFRSLGILYQAKDKAAQAETMFARALESNPNDAASLTTWTALVWRSGDHERAAQYTRRLLSMDPNQPAHYQNFANLSMELNRPNDAEAALRLACLRLPDNQAIQTLLDKFLALLGKSR